MKKNTFHQIIRYKPENVEQIKEVKVDKTKIKEEVLDIEINCINCEHSFQDEKSYDLHIRLTHSAKSKSSPKINLTSKSEPRIKCHKCLRTFKTSKSFRVHLNKIHRIDPRLELVCDLCGKILKSKASARIHMKVIHLRIIRKPLVPAKFENEFIDDKFVCKTCGKNYTSYEFFSRHKLTHFNEDLKNIPSKNHGTQLNCKKCEKSFKSETVFQIHDLVSHQESPDPEEMHLLENKMLRDCELNGFDNDNRKETKEVLTSNLCKEIVVRRQELIEYMTDKKHSSRVMLRTLFGCIECQSKFIDQSSLIFHMKT